MDKAHFRAVRRRRGRARFIGGGTGAALVDRIRAWNQLDRMILAITLVADGQDDRTNLLGDFSFNSDIYSRGSADLGAGSDLHGTAARQQH